MGGSNTQSAGKAVNPQIPAGPTLYNTDGSLVTMSPEQTALYNADQRKIQQQDAAFAANMERSRKQHEGQQNEAFDTAFANRDAKFSLPKTQPKFDSPNLYGREAKAPNTQK